MDCFRDSQAEDRPVCVCVWGGDVGCACGCAQARVKIGSIMNLQLAVDTCRREERFFFSQQNKGLS